MEWTRREMVGGAAKSVAIAATGAALAHTGLAEEVAWREGGSRVAGDEVERRFLYRASAFALSGGVDVPFRWTIEPQAVATLAAGGGRSSIRRGRFDAVTGASFESAESRVSGHRRSDGVYETFSEVVIEGLDLLGLVTADRIAARLRALYPPGTLAASPAGAAVEDLPLDTPFATLEMELQNLWALDAPVSPPSQMPSVDDPLAAAGYRIPLSEVGDLFVGQYLATPAARRLTILRLVLQGRLQGELAGGVLETSGSRWS